MQKARLYDAKKIPLVRLKDTWKVILPLQMSPCGIMDLSLAFDPTDSPHRLIHNPLSSLSRTITTYRLLPFVNYYDHAFGPTN